MSGGSPFVRFEARCWPAQARGLLLLAVAVCAGLGFASGRRQGAPDEMEKEAKKKATGAKTPPTTIEAPAFPSFFSLFPLLLYSHVAVHGGGEERDRACCSPNRKGKLRVVKRARELEAFARKREREKNAALSTN